MNRNEINWLCAADKSAALRIRTGSATFGRINQAVFGSVWGYSLDMEDLEHYLEDFVEPTIKDFEERPTSVRHAFLACVAVFHSLDYLAYNRATRSPSKAKVGKLKRDFGNASADFKLVDEAAHAFKHVVARGLPEQRLRSHEVVNRGGAFSSGFSSGFDVGAVTIVNRPEVNLLATVKQVVRFLREYKPVTRS